MLSTDHFQCAMDDPRVIRANCECVCGDGTQRNRNDTSWCSFILKYVLFCDRSKLIAAHKLLHE